MSERELLDAEALRSFLADELSSIRRFALSMTGSVDDADDVVQSTLERVLAKGLPADGPKPWLIRVCKNLWIDELRKRKVRNHEEYVEEGEGMSQVAQLVPNPIESDVARERRFAAIASAMDQLSEEHRLVLSMVVVEGMSYAEVAESLGTPVGTVMSRIARARANLKKNLGASDD